MVDLHSIVRSDRFPLILKVSIIDSTGESGISDTLRLKFSSSRGDVLCDHFS